MTIAADLFTRLSAHAGLGALVGAGSAARIYPLHYPANTPIVYPYLIWERTSAIVDQPFTQQIHATSARYEFSAFGSTYVQADAVRLALRQALTTLTGVTVNIHAVVLEDDRDDYSDPTGAIECSQDATILHTE